MAVDDEIGALEAEATAVSSRTFGDHRRSALKALAQLLPFAPFFTELWSEYVPTRRERRQVDFIAHDLARALDQVKQQVDQARILTDPYADVFEDVLAAVATRRGLDKRAYYAAVLANALTPEAPDATMQERMVATLDDLRPSHLRLLAHVTRDLAKPSSTGMERRGVYVEVWDGADSDIVRRDWRDLVDHGVLEPFQEKHRGTPFAMFDRTERAGTPISQVGDVTYLQATISSFGQRFATFIGVDGVVGLEHDDGLGGVRRE